MAQKANILDFESASRVRMLERVRSLTMTRDALVETARQNHAIQAQIHACVLAIIDAQDWRALDVRLQRSVRTNLATDFLGLIVENASLPTGLTGIVTRPEGFVAHIMQNHFERLGPCNQHSSLLYGKQSEQLLSEAIIRLDWGPGEALLVFASKDRRAFRDGQGTDLIAFFAKTLERTISRWA